MDEYYVNKVREGDINSFSYFIDKYKNIAFSIALKIVKNKQDAEEIVQDSFLKAYKSIDTFKGTAKFSTWLYKIVFNKSISKTRLKKLTTETLENRSQDSCNFIEINEAIQNIKQHEREYYIKLALRNLDEIDYVILTLYYYEEKTIKEIGEITNLDAPYIKVRLHRARGKLHFELKKLLKTEVNELL